MQPRKKEKVSRKLNILIYDQSPGRTLQDFLSSTSRVPTSVTTAKYMCDFRSMHEVRTKSNGPWFERGIDNT